ncbi:MAG: carbohydrate kinase, partial [Gammaproteobacteria bacterium]|nr:carbohydrate kinase [Gammaproteobacteria bacterium]
MARPAEPALVLGIDVGTQGVRAVAADGDGRILARRSRPLNTRPDDDERQEQDPSRWWDALRGCVQELA